MFSLRINSLDNNITPLYIKLSASSYAFIFRPSSRINMDNKSVPGVCNIGDAEIRRRKRIGWTWLLTSLIILPVLLLPGVPHGWRLILAFTSMVSATGFLQARMHFCAYFAALGIFNFGDDFSKKESVEKAEFRQKDRRKALQIIAYSAMIGIAAGAGGYFLPF